MYDFDLWCDRLKDRAAELSCEGVPCRFFDGRPVPELVLNPSFGVDLEMADHVGWIRFWKCGTCDYEVVNLETEAEVAEYMLEPDDVDVPEIFERFLEAFSPART